MDPPSFGRGPKRGVKEESLSEELIKRFNFSPTKRTL